MQLEPKYIYLHGFASSPQSAKAQYLRDRFAERQINLKTPDLNQGNFSHLTITRQLHQVEAEFPPEDVPVTLIGSSLGGWIAAWLGQRVEAKHVGKEVQSGSQILTPMPVQRLILLAPAFQFLSQWLPQLGEKQLQQWQAEQYLMVYHYGEKQSLPLSYEFVLDAAQYRDEQLVHPIPTLILHGRNDEVIPIQVSRDFAEQRPWVQLIELDSDHALGNVLPQIWEAIKEFCQLP